MSASADGYTASTDDYSASTDCHYNPNPRDDYDYPSGANGNVDGHCDSTNADNDGDSMDDSDSEPGSELSLSQS